MLLVVIGLIVLYVAVNDRYGCFVLAFDCLLNRTTLNPSTGTQAPTPQSSVRPAIGGISRLPDLSNIGNIGGGGLVSGSVPYQTPPFIPRR